MQGAIGASWWVTQFRLQVNGGRFVISGGEQVVRDSGKEGLANKICQQLLEPVLRGYVPIREQESERQSRSRKPTRKHLGGKLSRTGI